ncbi:metallophosphoesterase [Agrobacterium rubi]|nr:metallophosphoesterase [Agrobacterium rubi]NTF23968.1 metallophosphoesterase [Agrobacterium rubi]
MELDTIIFGDTHCDFTAIEEAAQEIDPAYPPVCIFVGDFGFADRDESNWEEGLRRDDLPLKDVRKPDEILRPLTELGCRILHVRGNHDFQDAHHYESVVASRALMGGNLHCKVVEIEGVRIAGLEGIFGGPWLPRDGKVVSHTREHWLANNRSYRNGNRWHPAVDRLQGIPPGLQVGHRKYIWPEDVEYMRGLEADVLVTHEPPLSGAATQGFQVINDLACDMGAKVVIHGHIHTPYEAVTSEGIEVNSIEIKSWIRLDLGQYRHDAERKFR